MRELWEILCRKIKVYKLMKNLDIIFWIIYNEIEE